MFLHTSQICQAPNLNTITVSIAIVKSINKSKFAKKPDLTNHLSFSVAKQIQINHRMKFASRMIFLQERTTREYFLHTYSVRGLKLYVAYSIALTIDYVWAGIIYKYVSNIRRFLTSKYPTPNGVKLRRRPSTKFKYLRCVRAKKMRLSCKSHAPWRIEWIFHMRFKI